MNTQLPARPLPEPTPESRPYWDGLREHRLRLQQCADCGTLRHYPRAMCAGCHSLNVNWVEAAGTGRVHSWTVAHHAFHPAFRQALPYILLTVDLPEGVRVLAPYRGTEADLRLDLPVRLVFEDVLPELTLPAFVAA